MPEWLILTHYQLSVASGKEEGIHHQYGERQFYATPVVGTNHLFFEVEGLLPVFHIL
jgi:hypothetical protein